MFADNKYRVWHDSIINCAKMRTISGYVERHHIIPRSLSGINLKTNIVRLTYREHFLVHWLLTKFVTGNAQRKMLCALFRMGQIAKSHGRITASWRYAVGRRAIRDARLGKIEGPRSEETKEKIRRAALGRKHGPETRAKLSKLHKGKKLSEKHKLAIIAANTGSKWSEESRSKRAVSCRGNKSHLGQKHSEETRKKMSISQMGNQNKKGFVASAETRKKMGDWQRGRTMSAESRQKMSLAKKGRRRRQESKKIGQLTLDFLNAN